MLILIALLLALAEEKKPAEPVVVAMVLRTGKGARLVTEKGKERSVEDMDLLRKGDVLTTDKEPVRLVFLEDGQGEIVQPNQRVTVEEKGSKPEKAVERLKAKMSKANLLQLKKFLQSQRGGVTVMRRSQDGPWPMAEMAVLSPRPDFTWAAIPGASYEVSVRRDGRVLWTVKTTNASLSYPRGEKDLPATTLTWSVTATNKDGKQEKLVTASEFRVAALLDRQTFAGLSPLQTSKDADDWVLAALVYEGEKYFAEALALYEKAAKQRPDSRNVLASLEYYYRQAGRTADAARVKKRLKTLGQE